MRAALCSTYGGPEVVEVTNIDAPPLGAGEVRVRVHVGAINFPDLLVIANTYQMSAPLPFVTGSEFSGVVSEVGECVEAVAVGQRVFGSCFVGAFADEVVVGAGALTPIPDDVDDRVAAAFGVAYKTAYHVLRSVA
ncbi:MAG: alcohol dehydrogenase catalytic domain-containing protein, partial [Acidimicrobiales bacterium]